MTVPLIQQIDMGLRKSQSLYGSLLIPTREHDQERKTQSWVHTFIVNHKNSKRRNGLHWIVYNLILF